MGDAPLDGHVIGGRALGGDPRIHPMQGRYLLPPFQPCLKALPIGSDPCHVIRPAHAGTDRDQENILQLVAPPAPRAGPPLAYSVTVTKHGALRPYVLLCMVKTHACYDP